MEQSAGLLNVASPTSTVISPISTNISPTDSGIVVETDAEEAMEIIMPSSEVEPGSPGAQTATVLSSTSSPPITLVEHGTEF